MSEKPVLVPLREAAWRAGMTMPALRARLNTADTWVGLDSLTSTVALPTRVTPLAVVDRGTV